MSEHFIEFCSNCGDVISQCRCPSEDKQKKLGLCSKCKASQGENNGKNR